jgi:hypothetical protein
LIKASILSFPPPLPGTWERQEEWILPGSRRIARAGSQKLSSSGSEDLQDLQKMKGAAGRHQLIKIFLSSLGNTCKDYHDYYG